MLLLQSTGWTLHGHLRFNRFVTGIGVEWVPDQAVVVASLEAAPEYGAEETIVEVRTSYDYLLSMPINSLTLEKARSTDSPQTFTLICIIRCPIPACKQCSCSTSGRSLAIMQKHFQPSPGVAHQHHGKGVSRTS